MEKTSKETKINYRKIRSKKKNAINSVLLLLDGFVSVTYLVQRHFLMSRSHIIIRVWRHLLETAVFITLVQTAGVIHPSSVLMQAELVQFLTPLK